MNRWATLGLLVAAAAALALRCPNLAGRPMHNDEAVNAVKFGALWEHGSWRYDPNEHHGPTLAFATLALSRLTAAPDYVHFTENRLRAVTVLFGVGLILLLPLFADGLGRGATAWAIVFTSVSPVMVFFSRDYIHEMLLVFFTLLALGAGWRYWRSRKLGWALLVGAALGLMQATKETFVLTLAAAAFALVLNAAWGRWFEAQAPARSPALKRSHLAAALGAWALVAVVLFSSFFTNAAGPTDALRTYSAWFHRAGGASPHLHPWTFYLDRLAWAHKPGGPVWTEALILALAAVGCLAAILRKGLADANAAFVRFLALYTAALTAIYSLIAYKTPWCLLSFWLGMLLLAGVGAMTLIQAPRHAWGRLTVSALLVLGTAHLAWQSHLAAAPLAEDRRDPFRGNPWVYAQTSPDLANLVTRIETLARVAPDGHDLPIQIIAPDDDYWPLPWHLRAFTHTGWWNRVPPDPPAPVVITTASLESPLDDSKTHVQAGLTELRPDAFLKLYVQTNLWHDYLNKHL